MGFLLDTNLISETSKIRPNDAVVDWFARFPTGDMFVSVISLGELRYGLSRLSEGKRRRTLETWLNDSVAIDYQNRVLPFDEISASIWGGLMRKSETILGGKNAVDMQLAATAVRHGLVFATRNIRHFAPLGLATVDPWNDRVFS